MAEEKEAGGLGHAKERCNLLRKLKHTVENLLMSDLENKWDTCDGVKKMIGDLERIIEHGKRGQQVGRYLAKFRRSV